VGFQFPFALALETHGHSLCRYENISHLINTMERVFDHQGYEKWLYPLDKITSADDPWIHCRFFWISNNSIMSKQKGVFRVNCIDCLDRTNVVQVVLALPTPH
jgi:hypothetical protein